MPRTGVLLIVALVVGSLGCAKQMDSAREEGFATPEMKTAAMDSAAGPRGAEGNALPASFQIRERSIIRRGEVAFRVERVKDASKEVLKIVKKHNGFVQSSSEMLTTNNPTMSIEVRVPVDSFDALLTDIEQIGTLLSRSTNSEDVTMQVVDLEARLKSMRLEEQAYQRIFLQAKKIPDVLQVQQRLTEIRGQIESMQAQYKTLREQTAYSTVNITLQQSAAIASEVQDKGWLGETWASALRALKAGGRATVVAVIWLVIMSPFWLVPLLILWLIVRRLAKTARPKPRSVPPIIHPVDQTSNKGE